MPFLHIHQLLQYVWSITTKTPIMSLQSIPKLKGSLQKERARVFLAFSIHLNSFMSFCILFLIDKEFVYSYIFYLYFNVFEKPLELRYTSKFSKTYPFYYIAWFPFFLPYLSHVQKQTLLGICVHNPRQILPMLQRVSFHQHT